MHPKVTGSIPDQSIPTSWVDLQSLSLSQNQFKRQKTTTTKIWLRSPRAKFGTISASKQIIKDYNVLNIIKNVHVHAEINSKQGGKALP